EEPAAAPPPGATTAAGDYKIGPEDLLDIAVWNNTAISRTVPVRPDGKISLPLLNDVQAAGLTPMQLREVLVKRLADYMPTPEVSVIVREVHSFKVSVLGEAKKPGQYELKSRSTVLDVIALAGGFTEFAARSRLVILRQAGATIKRVPFNYNNAASPHARTADFFRPPRDAVVVPRGAAGMPRDRLAGYHESLQPGAPAAGAGDRPGGARPGLMSAPPRESTSPPPLRPSRLGYDGGAEPAGDRSSPDVQLKRRR